MKPQNNQVDASEKVSFFVLMSEELFSTSTGFRAAMW